MLAYLEREDVVLSAANVHLSQLGKLGVAEHDVQPLDGHVASRDREGDGERQQRPAAHKQRAKLNLT